MALRDDDRGASTVIGAVFILGFLVIMLSVHQAEVVPTQNKQTEFDHNTKVQNEMVELRNAILEAKSTGKTTFAEVTLGTSYKNRIIGVNPAPPSGSLRTGKPEEIKVWSQGTKQSNLCPSKNKIKTRELRYKPNYARYDNAPNIVYENTVLYLDFGDKKILLTDEQLVDSDGANLAPLNSSFSANGIKAESIEPVPGNVKEKSLSEVNISYPTDLSEETWENLLSEDLNPDEVTVDNGKLEINTTGKISVACSPTGLNEAPAGGKRQTSGATINPAGPNDIHLENIIDQGGNQVGVVFNNTAGRDTNITAARLSFYNKHQNNDPPPLDILDPVTNNVAVQIDELEPLKELDPVIELAGNNTETTVSIKATNDNYNSKEWFVIQLEFENGATGTYFIDIPQ